MGSLWRFLAACAAHVLQKSVPATGSAVHWVYSDRLFRMPWHQSALTPQNGRGMAGTSRLAFGTFGAFGAFGVLVRVTDDMLLVLVYWALCAQAAAATGASIYWGSCGARRKGGRVRSREYYRVSAFFWD